MAAKVIDTTATRKVVSFLKDHWGEIYAVFDVLKGVVGKRTDVDPSLPPEEKLRVGLTGYGDEIKFIRAVLELDEEDQEILVGLIHYHFGSSENPRSWVKAAIAFAQMNKFRVAVTGLDSASKKVGTKKVVTAVKLPGFSEEDRPLETNVADEEPGKQPESTENKGQKAANGKDPKAQNPKDPKANKKPVPLDTETTTVSEDLYKGESKNTVRFLKHIVSVVKKAESESTKRSVKGKREDGFKAAVAYMHALGVPLMPNKKTLDLIDEFVPDSFDKLKLVGASINNHIRTQAAKNRAEVARWSPIRRFFYRLLS
ncbi:MAG: hypothetical protein KC877_05010 [Candidatus Kaiserbacteria bacterium]|nr:hypothetical protein [Candidatus Kaiserbacteria bacterium]MCB9815772.1 hypothetical protein [Candidatus Nomurabacteria bacterium]